MKCWPLCLGLFAVALSGCPRYNHYELDLKPAGDSLEPQLTCWHVGDKEPFPAGQLATAEQIYGQPPTTPAPGHFRFSGRFAGKTPQDVGGAGTYTTFNTPLGSITVYSERFRGNDDLVEQFEARGKAADRLAELITDWFETQMGGDPNWPQVRQFLAGDFHRDLNNLSLYFWFAQANAADDPLLAKTTKNDAEELASFVKGSARIAQYLSEHGYVEPEEFFAWAKAVSDNITDSLVTKQVQNVVAKKAGLGDEQAVAHSLGFLSDLTQVIASWKMFLERTPEYDALLRNWEEQKKTQPNAERPIPGIVLWNIVSEGLLRWKLLPNSDEINLELATGQRPFASNGQWDEQGQRIRWFQPIDEGSGLPTHCYAVWSTPDAMFQTEHFGKLLLRDRALAEYVATYLVLTDEEKAEWDGFIAGLSPEQRLGPAIRAFIVKEPEGRANLSQLKTMLLIAIKET